METVIRIRILHIHILNIRCLHFRVFFRSVFHRFYCIGDSIGQQTHCGNSPHKIYFLEKSKENVTY